MLKTAGKIQKDRQSGAFTGVFFSGCLFCLLLLGNWSCQADNKPAASGNEFPIRISENHHYFVTKDGQPFFWLGDTGWLLLSKLDKDAIVQYLSDRHAKGFNVIQVMLGHDLGDKDVYGRPAFLQGDLSRPDTLPAGDAGAAYTYWQLLDSTVAIAARNHMVIAMVPVWGSVVKSGKVSRPQAAAYASFLARRYRDKPNVVWMNGGDIPGSDSTAIWNIIGETIHRQNPGQLMTFHPRGRTQSSTWFQQADWLDFNCFQSGHRRYDQDTSRGPGELHYGEDNYRYVTADYNKEPVKPTLDAEPSYEGIPQGLHDTSQPKWQAADIRRYAYWSVFAGASGFTYGANSVMQFHDGHQAPGAYGATKDWHMALSDSAAGQLQFLKKLVLSRPYFERVPDSSLVMDQGRRYDYIAATRGKDYIYCYTFNGRPFKVRLAPLHATEVRIGWLNPATGRLQSAGTFPVAADGSYHADPPGEARAGNDWVLIIEKA